MGQENLTILLHSTTYFLNLATIKLVWVYLVRVLDLAKYLDVHAHLTNIARMLWLGHAKCQQEGLSLGTLH